MSFTNVTAKCDAQLVGDTEALRARMPHSDLLQNPLLVPLKQLAGPAPRGELCVLDVRWHPAQPWLLAAAADHTLRLYA